MKKLILFSALLAVPALAQVPSRVAGCSPGDFVTVTGPTAHVAIQGRSYVPRCLKVSKNTQVTVDATAHHPTQGIPNVQGLLNPLFDEFGGAVEARTHAFPDAGVFGFFCIAHSDDQGNGMGGAIWVE